MEKLYAAARAGKPAKLFAVLNARFHEQGSLYRRGSRRARRDHDRDQHGRPAAPKSSLAARSKCGSCTETPGSPTRPRRPPKIRAHQGRPSNVFREIVLKAEDINSRSTRPRVRSRPRPWPGPAGSTSIVSERHECAAHRHTSCAPLRTPGRSRALEILSGPLEKTI